MKNLLILMPLLLAACSTIQAINDRQIACEGLNSQYYKNSQWLQSCIKNDNIFAAAFEQSLHDWPKEKICYQSFINYDDPVEALLNKVISDRKINCGNLHTQYAKSITSDVDVPTLCRLWETNTGNPIMKDSVRREVKDRGADCVAVMSARAQQEAAAAARSQAAAAWSNALKPTYPTNTTCTTIGNMVNCNSY